MLNILHKIKPIDGLIVLGIGCIAVGIGIGQKQEETKMEIVTQKSLIPTVKQETISEVVVEIGGEVFKPGVYRLTKSSRINDVLVMAGGLTAKADRNWVDINLNRAEILTDGQKVYIPKLNSENYPLATGIAKSNQLININSANESDLDSLDGIGPGLAKRVIQYRQDKGNFKTTEEIKLVPGIGDSVYEKIKNKISI